MRAPASHLPSSMRLMVQVWGEEYTRLFTDLTVPALMSPHNLPALTAAFPSIFRIYTTDADVERIRRAPVFARLSNMIRVEFITIDLEQHATKYAAMTACNAEELRAAANEDAAIVFLVPDTIWSDGSLETIARAALSGKRAVMQAGVRVTADTALPEILRRFTVDESGVMTVPARDLVRLALDHMHPYYRGWFWDAPEFNRNPSNCYWRVGNEGLIARCFHLHPLMLYCARPVFSFVSTLDDDLPLLALPDFESLYIVEDSDEVFHVDLADREWGSRFNTLPAGPSAAYLTEWAKFCANLYHRRFAQHCIRFHAAPLGAEWALHERMSRGVMRGVRLRLLLSSVWMWLGELAFGVRRDAIVVRAAESRLGWDSLPPAPGWWSRAICLLRSAERLAAVEWLERRRRRVFSCVAQHVFGTNVASRALDLDLRTIKRARRLAKPDLWKPRASKTDVWRAPRRNPPRLKPPVRDLPGWRETFREETNWTPVFSGLLWLPTLRALWRASICEVRLLGAWVRYLGQWVGYWCRVQADGVEYWLRLQRVWAENWLRLQGHRAERTAARTRKRVLRATRGVKLKGGRAKRRVSRFRKAAVRAVPRMARHTARYPHRYWSAGMARARHAARTTATFAVKRARRAGRLGLKTFRRARAVAGKVKLRFRGTAAAPNADSESERV